MILKTYIKLAANRRLIMGTSMKTERQYITAISIMQGIITLIEPNGEIGYYRQRGIKALSPSVRDRVIHDGFLDKNWGKYPELPRNYTIYFEEPEIMGRAVATFPNTERIINLYAKKGIKI